MLGLSSISEQAISAIDNYIDIAYVSSTGGFYPEKKFNPYVKSKDYSAKNKVEIKIGNAVEIKKPKPVIKVKLSDLVEQQNKPKNQKVIKMKLSDLINGNLK